jgi:hypothetical protein
MNKLFTECAITKSIMEEARRIKPVLERAATKIQDEINYAAEHGRGEVVVHTDYFALTPTDRKAISEQLAKAGYKHRWHDNGEESERIHIWWEEDNGC